jgi:hypothetical protein
MSLFDKDNRILVSASQIINFNSCNRYWWWNKIQGKEIPFTAALSQGKKFHSCIEASYQFLKEGRDYKELIDYLKQEKFSHETIELVRQGWELKILKIPNKYLVEKTFKIPIKDFGLMRGAIDFYNVDDSRIEDHKTVGSWRYALTKDDLKKNIQLLIYSYYIFNKLPDKQCLTLRHNQFCKESPSDSTFIENTVTREESINYWNNNIVTSVKNMVDCSKQTEEKSVQCNRKHCSSYGGCPFARFCNP